MLPYEQTAFEIIQRRYDTVIIPLGSIEQHSRHLPVNCDTILAEHFGRALAQRLNAYMVPALPISTCREHSGVPCSVYLSPDVLAAVCTSLVECLVGEGYKNIVFFLGHGGIFALQPQLRHLNALYHGRAKIIQVNFDPADAAVEATGLLTSPVDLHAGELETSLLCYLAPQLVHMNRAVDFIPNARRDALNYTTVLNLSPDGVWGCPTQASAEKGEKLFDVMADAMADYVREVIQLMDNKPTGHY